VETGKLTSKGAMKKVKHTMAKSFHNVSEAVQKYVENITKDKIRDVGVLTKLSGLNKPYGLIID